MAVHNFRWHAVTTVDPKGRLSIPATYRQVIEGRGGGREILIGKHATDPCLVCYDPGQEEKLTERLDEQRVADLARGDADAHAKRSRDFFGNADIYSWDPSGRVSLHPFLKKTAKLDSVALFIGFGQGFEIWDLRTAYEQSDQRLREAAEFYLSERGEL